MNLTVTKRTKVMWLISSLVLTLAAVGIVINLVGQVASGYAFEGAGGSTKEAFFDAYVLAFIFATLSPQFSRFLHPIIAWTISIFILVCLFVDRFIVPFGISLDWYWVLETIMVAINQVYLTYLWRGELKTRDWSDWVVFIGDIVLGLGAIAGFLY